jgi:hypothetical protein
MAQVGRPATGFVSYAHVDQAWFERFQQAMEPIQSEGILRLWSDHAIMPGEYWHPELMKRMDEADLIILLVTPAFLASPFCFGKEMRRGLARHDAGLARVIPILLEPCEWKETPLAHVQGVPHGMKPVSKASDPYAVLQIIARDLRAAALQVRSSYAAQLPYNELRSIDDAGLMRMMDNVRGTMSIIETVIAAYPAGQQPLDKLIELNQLKKRLESYEAEFNRRTES